MSGIPFWPGALLFSVGLALGYVICMFTAEADDQQK